MSFPSPSPSPSKPGFRSRVTSAMRRTSASITLIRPRHHSFPTKPTRSEASSGQGHSSRQASEDTIAVESHQEPTIHYLAPQWNKEAPFTPPNTGSIPLEPSYSQPLDGISRQDNSHFGSDEHQGDPFMLDADDALSTAGVCGDSVLYPQQSVSISFPLTSPSPSPSPSPLPVVPESSSAYPDMFREPASFNDTPFPSVRRMEWVVYDLPDGTTYYVHPILRITSDVDLRSADEVDVGKGREEMELWILSDKTRRWVDHIRREVFGQDGVEYTSSSYWSFMESHPAHRALPKDARSEAMEALSWAWTDHLLPSSSAPAPSLFTQEECRNLLSLLRSFEDDQSPAHTRAVSRILMRVEWRKEPRLLPLPVSKPHMASQSLLSAMFLYLFFARRNEGSTVMVGASTCFVAWTLTRALGDLSRRFGWALNGWC